jgi:signal transduction histidine kinase
VAGEFNLSSAQPEAAALGVTKPYELPRSKEPRTLVFKVQYVPGGDDLVTVWLEPRLRRGATEENQPPLLTTKFKANASFDQIRLRHSGGGNGWIFSDMAMATSFNDFVVVQFWERWWFTTSLVLVILGGVVAAIRLAEKRKYQGRLRVLEQQRIVDLERARIAEDLHDDLGSSLARITLLADLIRQDTHHPDQVEVHARRLAESADETVRSFEEIVWAVRPGSDTLQSLVHYLAHVATELFEHGPARCRLDLPHDLPERPLPPDFRHNVFLIVKEALTNALKHSQPQEVRLRMRADERWIEVQVQDDGRGFDPQAALPQGLQDGLGNMQRRAEALGAVLDLESAVGQGTTLRLRAPFPEKSAADNP